MGDEYIVSWPEICLRRVNNEIHYIQRLREALPSQVFQVVVKSNQRAKGWQRAHFVSDKTRPGPIVPKILPNIPFRISYVTSVLFS